MGNIFSHWNDQRKIYNDIVGCMDIDENTGKFQVNVGNDDRRGTVAILDDTMKRLK